jgi:hypothetical protein
LVLSAWGTPRDACYRLLGGHGGIDVVEGQGSMVVMISIDCADRMTEVGMVAGGTGL